MRVLVTGGSGFIGRHLVAHLAARHQVEAPSRAELDLLDADQVRTYLHHRRFDAVIHAATDRSNRLLGSPSGLLERNLRMFHHLVRDRATFGRLLFLSSGAVYDRARLSPQVTESEFARLVPDDAYGFSKYCCATSVHALADAYELRCFAVFGPHEDWRVRFLSNVVCRTLLDLPIVIRQNVRFDFLDVRDLAHAVERILTARAPAHRAYNVCAGTTWELVALARRVLTVAGKELPIHVKMSGLAPEYSGSTRRLSTEFPDLVARPIDDSIQWLLEWYDTQRSLIDPAQLAFDA